MVKIFTVEQIAITSSSQVKGKVNGRGQRLATTTGVGPGEGKTPLSLLPLCGWGIPCLQRQKEGEEEGVRNILGKPCVGGTEGDHLKMKILD